MRPGCAGGSRCLGRAFKDALFASPEGAQPMEPLRGTARRVIVVPSPDPRVFEQAVFIVSDDYLHTPGKSQTELLRRAREAAGKYASEHLPPRRARPQLVPMLTGGHCGSAPDADAPYAHRTYLGAKIPPKQSLALLRGIIAFGYISSRSFRRIRSRRHRRCRIRRRIRRRSHHRSRRRIRRRRIRGR